MGNSHGRKRQFGQNGGGGGSEAEQRCHILRQNAASADRMSTTRRYLLASSLARLLLRERSAVRIVEGHFPPSQGRRSYVLFEDASCNLVLISNPGSLDEEEERTEVPSKQGQFLLEVCAGTLAYHRAVVPLGGGREAAVSSYTVPGAIHLIEVEFDDADQADSFMPPIWFGPDVTGDEGYDHTAMATAGLPKQPIVAISDAGLNALLDLLEYGGGGAQRPAVPIRQGNGVVEPLRPAQGA
jgi:CYTH domain-containing protein